MKFSRLAPKEFHAKAQRLRKGAKKIFNMVLFAALRNLCGFA
jgi:hypothetical protein